MRFIITVIFVLISAFLSAAEFIGNHKTAPAGTLQIIQVDNPEEVGDIYLLKTPEGKFFLVDTGLLQTLSPSYRLSTSLSLKSIQILQHGRQLKDLSALISMLIFLLKAVFLLISAIQ